MKKFFFDCGTREAQASAGLFALRLGTGLMMAIGHGWQKFRKFSDMKDDFEAPKLPLLEYMSGPVALSATIFAELVCAILIVLGLATRPAAFVLGFTMLVAAFHVHGGDPFFMGGGAAKEPALLYFVPCLALVLAGAGGWSLDRSIYQEKKRRFF